MIVRYADDSVLGFESKSDVDRFIADMKVRFAQFGQRLTSATRMRPASRRFERR